MSGVYSVYGASSESMVLCRFMIDVFELLGDGVEEVLYLHCVLVARGRTLFLDPDW